MQNIAKLNAYPQHAIRVAMAMMLRLL